MLQSGSTIITGEFNKLGFETLEDMQHTHKCQGMVSDMIDI